jgi:hypothetical protein
VEEFLTWVEDALNGTQKRLKHERKKILHEWKRFLLKWKRSSLSEKRFLLEWNRSRGTDREETGESDPVGSWSRLAPPRAPHLQPHLLTVGSKEKIWIRKSMESNLRK